jgi:hypothetical protein
VTWYVVLEGVGLIAGRGQRFGRRAMDVKL